MASPLLLAALLAAAPALALHTAQGRPAVLARPGVVMFWRSDCAPCRLELGDLPALRRAAAPLPLQLVSLDAASAAWAGRFRRRSKTHEDPAKVLTDWGGAPPRLPLAVALDPSGQVCARHTGLIGRDRLRAWSQACGGALARR